MTATISFTVKGREVGKLDLTYDQLSGNQAWAAKILGVSRKTLWKWTALGKIKQGPNGVYLLGDLLRFSFQTK